VIDEFPQWSAELAKSLQDLSDIGKLLAGDEVFKIERLLLVNSVICRGLFDEAKSLSMMLNRPDKFT
jgi:hypothetical protein